MEERIARTGPHAIAEINSRHGGYCVDLTAPVAVVGQRGRARVLDAHDIQRSHCRGEGRKRSQDSRLKKNLRLEHPWLLDFPFGVKARVVLGRRLGLCRSLVCHANGICLSEPPTYPIALSVVQRHR